jgi:hypothetical protein
MERPLAQPAQAQPVHQETMGGHMMINKQIGHPRSRRRSPATAVPATAIMIGFGEKRRARRELPCRWNG